MGAWVNFHLSHKNETCIIANQDSLQFFCGADTTRKPLFLSIALRIPIELYHAMLKQKISPVSPLTHVGVGTCATAMWGVGTCVTVMLGGNLCDCWTGKNRAFCSPGTQNGRRVIKVYCARFFSRH